MALLGAFLVLTLLQPLVLSADLTSHVNLFLGTENGGNNFPGAARPFGMVKLGPDLFISGTDAYSGYLPNGKFSGFSMMHEQGTGGAPKYGTVSQLPLIGNISNPLSNKTVARTGIDQASVGYYKAQTSEGTIVELSASAHAGMYQYTFPKGSTGNVLVDVSHVLPSFRGQGLGQGYKGGNITIFPDGHYEGQGVYDNGWNRSPDWSIYFCGYFDAAPVRNRTYTGSDAEGSVEQTSGFASSSSSTTRVGGLFTFQQTVVTSRVGISWLSTEKACKNVHDEIPEGTEFTSVVRDTQTEWSSKSCLRPGRILAGHLLSHIIKTFSLTGLTKFQDLFRCSTALMQVLQPAAYEEQIRSLIDIWRFEGYLPDARSSNYNGRTQGGSNADNILADAYVKGVRGAVNWEDGYRAMVKDAEIAPPNDPVDSMAPDSSTKEGRGALPDWLSLGFITPKYSRAATRAVEYSCNDFGLSQVASGLGKGEDADKYLNRSRNWRNHWNSNQTSLGFSGFVVPRDTTGFIETDPLRDSGYWGDPYYEASSWAYSWASVHDMEEMIEMMGGAQTVLKRLDTMFTEGASGSSGIIFDPTNEPVNSIADGAIRMFNIPYLYHYIDRQDLSVSRSRNIAKTYYHTGVNGLPGNSDAGAMQTWLLWNMIGLYPITGQTTFLVHSPWFESMTIELGDGKKLSITATGGDGNGDSQIYVQKLRLNGKDWKKNWLTWNDIFAQGGTLEFELGEAASDWFTDELPPSPAS
ncbi:glycosyl hydrolase [Aspergillus arachidicola]|uniref:Glycosyl hydrolase n=1 Tax=Aspergillus arachidicola TaxID=656916 RepID=A0A2G7G3Z3_9EURO|nr:glycosyl hydrolase [Aspergillus arachidicola]